MLIWHSRSANSLQNKIKEFFKLLARIGIFDSWRTRKHKSITMSCPRSGADKTPALGNVPGPRTALLQRTHTLPYILNAKKLLFRRGSLVEAVTGEGSVVVN
jgi:hypothetical protein